MHQEIIGLLPNLFQRISPIHSRHKTNHHRNIQINWIEKLYDFGHFFSFPTKAQNHHHFPPTAIPPPRSSAIAVNCSSAACKSSTMLAARTSGEASVSAPSRLSSRSQKRSRLTLSRLSSSS